LRRRRASHFFSRLMPGRHDIIDCHWLRHYAAISRCRCHWYATALPFIGQPATPPIATRPMLFIIIDDAIILGHYYLQIRHFDSHYYILLMIAYYWHYWDYAIFMIIDVTLLILLRWHLLLTLLFIIDIDITPLLITILMRCTPAITPLRQLIVDILFRGSRITATQRHCHYIDYHYYFYQLSLLPLSEMTLQSHFLSLLAFYSIYLRGQTLLISRCYLASYCELLRDFHW